MSNMRKSMIIIGSVIGVVVLFLAGTGYYAFRIMPQNTLASIKKNAPVDAIIVPGYPFQNNSWSRLMRDRVYWSYYLYQNNYTRYVIYSGSAVYSPYIEGEIMALYAEKLGIPPDRILTETNAEHSTENLFYSYRLAKEKGFSSIALASDPVQTLMLIPFANQENFDISYLPIDYSTLTSIDKSTPSIHAKSAYVDTFRSLTERQGFWERLKGTLGKKIQR